MTLLAAAIVLLICYTMLRSPAIGVGIYLLLYNSIFCVAERLYMPLPRGVYIAVYASLFLGALLHSRKRCRREPPGDLERSRTRQARGVLCWAVLPYLIWMTFTAGLGLMSGAVLLDSTVSFLLTATVPFVLTAVAFLLRDQRALLLRVIAFVVLVTAVIQAGVAMSGSQSLMFQAYYWSAGELDPFVHRFLLVEGRGTPTGITLITFMGVFAVASILMAAAARRRRKGMGVLCVMVFVGVFSTVSRGPMVSLVAGSLCAVAMGLTIPLGRRRIVGRLLFTLVLLVAVTGCVTVLVPRLATQWVQRMSSVGNEAGSLFDEDVNNTRGIENVVALRLLLAKPYVGWGSMDIMLDNTLINDPQYGGRDVHSFLKMGLIGGVPLMLLLVWMYFGLFLGFWRLSRSDLSLHGQMIPFLCIVLTSFFLTILGLSRIISSEAGPFALFAGLLAAYYATHASADGEPTPSRTPPPAVSNAG